MAKVKNATRSAAVPPRKVEKVAKGLGVTIGLTTKLRLRDLWVHMFLDNAEAGPTEKLTDEALQEFVQTELPNFAKPDLLTRVASARKKYNKGGLTDGAIPEELSVAYGDDGLPLPAPVSLGSEERQIKRAMGENGRREKVAAKVETLTAKIASVDEKETARKAAWLTRYALTEEELDVLIGKGVAAEAAAPPATPPAAPAAKAARRVPGKAAPAPAKKAPARLARR